MNKKIALIALITFIMHGIFPSQAIAMFGFTMPEVIPGETQGISVVGSTVLVKGLTHQSNQAFINGREVKIQSDGSFLEQLIIPLGETEVIVAVEDSEGLRKEYRKIIVAKENHFFAAGIADGTLNFSDASDGYVLKRDSQTFDDGFDADGKISYYMNAKVKGKILVKSALDTDKDPGKNDLFTHVDPDDYFPIYGDNSTVVYDANSQGKFFAEAQWEKSGAVAGNYQTQIGDDDAKLIQYDRTLFGGKVYLETPEKTIYGDPVHKSTFYWAEANQNRGHSQLFATGGSLYYFRHRNIVEGSEQVRIEVRDKNSGRVIHEIAQSHDLDYEIKYDEGRITFNQPVMSIATSDTLISQSVLEGNPVYVVAHYEYDDQDAFPITPQDLDHQTAGFRISQHLGDHIRGGITYVQEEKDAENLKQIGGDVTIKLGNFTKVNAEFAHTKADSTDSYISYNGGYDYTRISTPNGAQGNAFRVEANTAVGEYLGKGEEYLNISGYWQRVDPEFAATDSLFEAGSEKFGVDISHRFDENDKARILYEQGSLRKGSTNPAVENQLQARRVDHLTAQWEHEEGPWSFLTEYSYQQNQTPLTPAGTTDSRTSDHIIAEKIQYELNENTTVFASQQLGLSDINESFTTLGASTRLNEEFTAHGQVGFGPKGNSLTAGLEQVMDNHHSRYLSWTYSDSVIDGKSSATSFGMNSQLSETATLRRERQFISSDKRGTYASEVVGLNSQLTPEFNYDITIQRRDERGDPVLGGTSAARDAYTAAFEWVKPDLFKIRSKAEYRINSDHLWQVLLQTDAEWKVTQDIFLFGEHEYSQAENSLSKIDKKQVALAFRPVDFDWFNGLFKYVRLTDDRPQSQFSADGGFFEMQSKSDLFAAEFAFDLPWHFQYVQKLAYLDKEIIASNTTGTINTPDDIEALLWAHRLNFHVSDKIDLATEWRRLRREGALVSDRDAGFLFEVTYQVLKNIGIGLGFNFTAFKDDLTDTDHRSARGFFLRLQGKY